MTMDLTVSDSESAANVSSRSSFAKSTLGGLARAAHYMVTERPGLTAAIAVPVGIGIATSSIGWGVIAGLGTGTAYLASKTPALSGGGMRSGAVGRMAADGMEATRHAMRLQRA